MISRRALLTGIGVGVAGLGGVGYSRRRRLQRRDDLREIDATLGIDAPIVDGGAVVTDAHLEAAFDRTEAIIDDAIETVEAAGEDPDDVLLRSSVAESIDTLEASGEDPDAVLGDVGFEVGSPADLEGAPQSERRSALRRLARRASGIRGRLGSFQARRDEHDWTDLEERYEAERTALEAVEVDYRGSSLGAVIVQYAAVDRRLQDAATSLARGEERFPNDGDDYGATERYLERATAYRRDVERFSAATDGPDHTAQLETALDRVQEAVEDSSDAVDWDHPEAEWNFADTVTEWRQFRWSVRVALDDLRDGVGPYLARSLQVEAFHHAVFESLDGVAAYPARREWDVVHPSIDAAELPAAKRSAIDAIERAADEYGDEPLARWLLSGAVVNNPLVARRPLGGAVANLEIADARLERLRDDVGDLNDDQWRDEIAAGYLRSLEAVALANAVPETLTTVLE